MVERLAVSGRHADVEELRNGGQIGFAGSGEVPMLEGLFGVLAGVGAAVAAQDLRCVVGWDRS